jgi:hypothetical protein
LGDLAGRRVTLTQRLKPQAAIVAGRQIRYRL